MIDYKTMGIIILAILFNLFMIKVSMDNARWDEENDCDD